MGVLCYFCSTFQKKNLLDKRITFSRLRGKMQYSNTKKEKQWRLTSNLNNVEVTCRVSYYCRCHLVSYLVIHIMTFVHF